MVPESMRFYTNFSKENRPTKQHLNYWKSNNGLMLCDIAIEIFVVTSNRLILKRFVVL
jgi:hypothetical protein